MRYLILFFCIWNGIAAKAQWSDDFSDGELDSNPEWLGDTGSFVINPSGELQLNASAAGSAALYVHSAPATINNMEWRFRIRLNFSPSSANYARVYLLSDQPDPSGPLNGYFLQFGEALSNDAVELFRQDGSSLLSVCRARDAQIASSFTIGVKVTRDDIGLWTLYIDPAGGDQYVQEAFGAEAMFTAGDWFCLQCVFTTGNRQNFFFDDFYFGPIQIDTTPPQIVRPHDVVFNEIYFEPLSDAALPAEEFVEIVNRSGRTLSLNGWTLSDGPATASFPAGAVIANGEFAILCAMTDSLLFNSYGRTIGLNSFPGLNNDSGDRLELRDKSGALVDVVTFSNKTYRDLSKDDGGWTLERIDTSFLCPDRLNWRAAVSLSGGTPGAVNSVAGVYRDLQGPYPERAFAEDSVHIKVVFSEPLDVAGAVIPSNFELMNESQTAFYPVHVELLDDISVRLTLGAPLRNETIRLMPSSALADCPGNAALDRTLRIAFPEAPAPGDLVVSEMLFNPPEGGSDFVEIVNRSGKVIDLMNVRIAEADHDDPSQVTSSKVISGETRLIFPGELLAVSEDPDFLTGYYPQHDRFAMLQVDDIPDFNSTEGAILIIDANGNLQDRVVYTDQLHYPLIRDAKGISLERLSGDQPSEDPANWHSAAANTGFATPGKINSQRYEPAVINDGEISISPLVFSPDNDGYDDVTALHYSFPEPGHVASCHVFSEDGRVIKNIVNNMLLGNEGVLFWDGLSEDGLLVPEGRYVFLLETFKTDGGRTAWKGVFGLSYPND